MNYQLKLLLRHFLPKKTSTHRIIGGPLRGKKILTSWHDYPAAITGRTERPLLEWFAKNVKPGETWLDVGAHYGYTAIALTGLVGSSGRVFAFEPMISTAGYLTQTRRLNKFRQLTVLPVGLAAPETLELRQLPTTRGMVDSTLFKQESGGQKGQEQAVWQETIMVARLDWLWPYICGGQEQINGVKIDVQGMEIEAVQGMSKLLKLYKPRLVIEVHRGVDRKKLLCLLERTGYSPRGIPIEPSLGEIQPWGVDDRNYAFRAI